MRDALALALVHFLWQGALLALAGAGLMRVAKSPSVRYAIGVATMFAMLLAPVSTTFTINRAEGSTLLAALRSVSTGQTAGDAGNEPTGLLERQRAAGVDANGALRSGAIPTTWILTLWAIGVMVLSLRFVGGWAVARRLATQTLTPVGEELQHLASQMAARLNVRAAVRVCESASMAVPVMLGCLRPVIILPSAVVASLPLAQLEALLAHEFAHIRRHDYLVNLLQTGVETLCFYHPAVWWISREVRRHREQCCDDVAVGVCDRLTYVTALSAVASIATPQFALSATGGSLRDRVRRLIDPTATSTSPKGVWIAMLPIILVIALVAPQARSASEVQSSQTQLARREEQGRAAQAAREAAELQAVTERRLAQRVQEARAGQEVETSVRERRAAELVQARRQAELARDVERMISGRSAQQAEEIERVIEFEREAQNVERRRAQREIMEVEPERARAQRSRYESAMLESQLKDAERALARQRQLFEKGLLNEDALHEAEQRLYRLGLSLEQSRLDSSMMELGSQRRDTLVAELERFGLSRGAASALDSSAVLQAHDRLTITIAGEPDLPSDFTVRDDGSIRFPFLGTIRVQGSTTEQVQSAIRKLIADRGLASGAAVTVTARRSR